MRIAFITHHFLPDSIGGGETHTFHLAKALQQRNHSVVIWRTCMPPSSLRSYSHHGLEVIAAPADQYGQKDRLAVAQWIERQQKECPRDVVHGTLAGNAKALLELCVERKIPTVVTLLDFDYWCPSSLVKPPGGICTGPESIEGCNRCQLTAHPRLQNLASAWGLLPRTLQTALVGLSGNRLTPLTEIASRLREKQSFFNRVLAPYANFIAPSPIMHRIAVSSGVAADRVLEMPYGVPESFVAERQEKSPSPSLRIGFFGRLVPSKGVHVLIEAFRSVQHQQCSLRVYGTAPPGNETYVQNLKQLAAIDSRIELLPPVSQEDFPGIHRDLDIVVVPSLWPENATITLLESLALGTVSIVSDVEGMAPFVRDGIDGFRFAPGSVPELSQRIAWCVEHLESVRTMSQNCRVLLTIEEQAARMEQIYDGLIKNNGHSARQALDLSLQPATCL